MSAVNPPPQPLGASPATSAPTGPYWPPSPGAHHGPPAGAHQAPPAGAASSHSSPHRYPPHLPYAPQSPALSHASARSFGPGRHTSPPPNVSRRSSWLTVAWGGGVVGIVTSTFLPWLYSGRVGKNSYQLTGVSRRRLDLAPGLDIALAAWPFVGPLWAVVAVIFLLGARRTAVIVSMVLAALVGTVVIFAAIGEARLSSGLISAAYAGPICAGAGALVVLGSSVALLIAWRDRASVAPNH